MTVHFDAIIIGAGPAGSAAAILLARAGWSVALVERQSFPRRAVCGGHVAASNLPLLQWLGVGALLEAHAGAPLRRVALISGDSVAQADLPASRAQCSAHRWGRPIGRDTLDLLLGQQAERVGAELWQPWSVQAVRGARGHWECDLRSTEADVRATLSAGLLIAAHGSWEPAHWQGTPPKPPPNAADLLAFTANFKGARLPDGLLAWLALEGGYGSMVSSAPGTVTVACCVRRDRLARMRLAAPHISTAEALEGWLRRQGCVLGRTLSDAQRSQPWLAAGPIAPGIRLRADDAILRIGNAAGEAHPMLGDGISMALQSAALLCGRLLAGPTPGLAPDAQRQAAIARDHAASWRAAFQPRLRAAAWLAQVAMRRGPAQALLALAQAWPGLLPRAAHWRAATTGGAVDLARLAPPGGLAVPTYQAAPIPQPPVPAVERQHEATVPAELMSRRA